MQWWNALLPVVTLALGWAGAEWSDARRTARERETQRQARLEQRDQSASDRRVTFEEDTLGDLYDALGVLGRLANRVHNADVRVAREAGLGYGRSRIDDDELSDSHLKSHVEARRLARLVLDDSLRARAHGAIDALSTIHLIRDSIDVAEAAMDQAAEDLKQTQELVAARLRSLYRGEVTRGISAASGVPRVRAKRIAPNL